MIHDENELETTCHLHSCKAPDSIVFGSQPQTLPHAHSLRVNPLFPANVRSESIHSANPFVLCKPLCAMWEVWQHEERADCDENGEGAF